MSSTRFISVYMDTSCRILGGQIIFDLFKKPTDKHVYLLLSSCHPPHQHQNIPFRVCSTLDLRPNRLKELRNMLVSRSYKPGMIEGVIKKARCIPRDTALRKVVKAKQTKRPVAVVSWDPRLPLMDSITPKH